MPPSSSDSKNHAFAGDIVFSGARPQDYARIAQLHAASWQSAYRGIVSQEYLDNGVVDDRLTVWKKGIGGGIASGQFGTLASRGGGLIGFIWVRLDADAEWGCAIDNLHVHPGAKGLGVGRELMSRAAERVILERPGSPVFLFVLEANHAAVGFYDRQGGACQERTSRPTGDGGSAPALRYVWTDPSTLIESARTPSGV